ncbi:methyltransferase domain-containing protein [Amycolatopsis nigrescens]|uniref:methyltransferase domain-containing protein n=1 Tax=Amycolatopsis nigrescens TaxID=381445 RepID=UPI000363CCBF|nr:methyltransferase domain-containing protein [Amycolatopsis nigrescens]
MTLKDSLVAGLAKQLGHPRGVRGKLVGRMLNRANNAPVAGAVEALELRAGETAADIGFGGGLGLSLLLGRVGPAGAVHGVEVSETMFDGAVKRFGRDERVRLHRGSITELPLADASLDALITCNTLYFVAEPAVAFAELARVLRPGGRAVVGIGDPAAMAEMPFTPHGFRLRPVSEVVGLLGAAGLEVREDRRIGRSERAFHLLIAGR